MFSSFAFAVSLYEINNRMSWLFHRWLTFFGISLLVFNDCRSLFLRHTDSGRCITASDELAYDAPNLAFPYFVVMTDNCLNVSAQFRYLDNELLHNTEKKGTLISSTHVSYHDRWAVYKGVSSSAKRTQNSTNTYRLKQTDAGSLFLYDKSRNVCAEPATIYVLKNATCDTEKQKFTFGSVTAYNAKMEYVHCSPKQKMVVKSADYGDFNKNGAFNDDQNIDTTCSKLTNCQVKSLCGGNRSCELTMDKNLLPSQYCSDTLKEIYTKYTCVDTYGSSTITTAPRIRLSNRNTGFIEIRDGSTWRRVVEEYWDKNRQKMLCQHLGFEETADNKIVKTKQLGSGQNIATGDFVCYNTIQPSGTSCCIHLEPSTSPPSTKIPYVQCKICDKPLLHDANTFPDSIFSGSGDSNDNYKHARITKSGWCPSGTGTRYLMLDLQKQYHITKVVVMADSSQTRWSSSYSLKYSHNKTSMDGSSAIPIKGNKYRFKASTTNLTIYNVRYLKIESTENQNFCLRIELCGEVQTPAPVKNINVSPSDYSARVTWEMPTPQDSSYVTHYFIYLNNKFVKEISRAMYGTEFNILPLKPNTENTFGIQTKDGSVQGGTYVSETFTTKQAEPFTYGSIAISYSSLTISKPPAYIKEVMVIVQISSDNPKPVESLKASDLKPYQANTQDPYITAYFKTDVLPLTFMIGDGKEYNSEKQKYFNQPLKQNSSYILFLRFFENQNSYYSTEWSNTTRTFAKPPDKASPNDTSCGTEWYIVVVTLVSGIIIGILLSYIVSCSRRKFRRRRQPRSNHKPKTTEADATYQELDLTKLNTEDNYQSLRVNAEEESTYTELNQTRDVEDNYQSLT